MSLSWVLWGRRRRGGCWARVLRRCGVGVRCGAQRSAKTEAIVSGQLALVMGEQTVVAAAVWETLPVSSQQAIVLGLARLLARLVEDERDE